MKREELNQLENQVLEAQAAVDRIEHDYIRLDTYFNVMAGPHILALNKAKYENAALAIELTEILKSLENDIPLDDATLEQNISAQMDNIQNDYDNMNHYTSQSMSRHAILDQTDTEQEEIQSLYVSLLYKKRPHIHPDFSDQEIEDWNEIEEAYVQSDLKTLRQIDKDAVQTDTYIPTNQSEFLTYKTRLLVELDTLTSLQEQAAPLLKEKEIEAATNPEQMKQTIRQLKEERYALEDETEEYRQVRSQIPVKEQILA